MKKTKEDAQQTKEEIMEVAKYLFCIRGYARTNLSDIALKAGVSRGAVYWHFKNKDELFIELWRSMILDKKNFYFYAVENDLCDTSSYLNLLRKRLLSIRDFLLDESNIQFIKIVYRVIMSGEGTNRIKYMMNDVDNSLQKTIQYYLNGAKSNNELPRNISIEMAENYISSVVEGYIIAFVFKNNKDLINNVDIIVDNILSVIPKFVKDE